MIPAGYQRYQKPSLRKVINRIVSILNKEDRILRGNYLVSELINIISQSSYLNESKILYCSICKQKYFAFIHLCNSFGISWNSVCPNCNSRSRQRGLIFLYREFLKNSNKKKFLHFAPEPILEDEIKKYNQHNYYITDYKIPKVNFKFEDAQIFSFNNEYFDLILSNHVLEHIPNDNKAVNEMARILRNNGFSIITVPGDWKNILTKKFLDLRHNGHYRHYGLDILEILYQNFSNFKKVNLSKYGGKKFAIKES